MVTIKKETPIGEAILITNQEGIDQIPVTESQHFVGSVNVSSLLEKGIQDPVLKDLKVGEVMDIPMLFVAPDSTLDVLSSLLYKNNKAVLIRDENEKVHIITQHDILRAITG